eukprot:13605634-Ditylum_brightwellii.AAC.1
MAGDKLFNNAIWMAVGVSIAGTMGLEGIPLMSATSSLPTAKTACALNARKNPARIAKALSYQEEKEKADLNKFEALSILSGSNAGDNNSKSKVSYTSNKGLDSK